MMLCISEELFWVQVMPVRELTEDMERWLKIYVLREDSSEDTDSEDDDDEDTFHEFIGNKDIWLSSCHNNAEPPLELPKGSRVVRMYTYCYD